MFLDRLGRLEAQNRRGVLEILLDAEVPFCGLNRAMAKGNLATQG
jgi:hypothetical protein